MTYCFLSEENNIIQITECFINSDCFFICFLTFELFSLTALKICPVKRCNLNHS